MKGILVTFVFLCMVVGSYGQASKAKNSHPDAVWHDGTEFPIFGKATDQTLSVYDRLPASYQNVSRKPLWKLGRNTAGLYLRFRSDSPSLFVLDYVPNATADRIREAGEEFFNILRKAHPKVPVILVERPIYPHSILDRWAASDIKKRNDAQREVYLKLRKAGHKKIYYLETEKILGDDREDTVDGVHSTDVGAERYVKAIMPIIKKAL